MHQQAQDLPRIANLMAQPFLVNQRLLLIFRLLGICLILATQAFTPANVQAANGLPDTMKFGYGARLNPLGQEVSLALNTSASIGLDWIGVDFDWDRLWPTRNDQPKLDALDAVISNARKNRVNVMLSITNPPDWALTRKGPKPEITAGLVSLLATRYQESVLAIELFPEANTVRGWGAPPNPQAYAALLSSCWGELRSIGSPAILVAGGLRQVSAGQSSQDMDDLAFLNALYDSGAGEQMPVISLHLTDLSGTPIAAPDKNNAQVLRRYELIRQIMLKQNHNEGLIWITGFSWPDSDKSSPEEQSLWMNQAFQLMRSQLYIGAAFVERLNPPLQPAGSSNHYLIQNKGQATRLHPALYALAQLITLDRTGQLIHLPSELEKISSSTIDKSTSQGGRP